MEHVVPCPACRGEGRRTQPPYDYKYHNRPLRWRAAEDCDGCGGRGVLAATPEQIAHHAHAAATDYGHAGWRFPS